MGVVNVTPDSFSDGGKWLDAPTAIQHGIDLVRDGADLVDVGGESTRPGASRIDGDEELRRVIPVIQGLVAEGITVSVDTMRASTAQQALDSGAVLVNDVSGGRADPGMMRLAAQAHAPIVLMHWRAHSALMQHHTHYDDLVDDIVRELMVQLNAAVHAGVDPERIVLDPGLGFSKTGEQNWTVLAHLDAFVELRHPVLVAASRKRFLGELLADDTELRPTDGRDDATAAITTIAAQAGAWCVRVHEPAASADAVRVVARLAQEAG
ncbi:dihydropteroate synthase [Aeromicrobium sp. Root344]|uniref:dihydropteroate synthase n=1 Tax=Aeromicrobium sp. Root344 TaxID=1736521 RepID=UPI0006F8775D|nr:dihydropteroate synthase [Aeromicrobium sp. Root344]KQV74337.1 dihydropteroate synthase [Aeromicrobium sp. Root344]